MKNIEQSWQTMIEADDHKSEKCPFHQSLKDSLIVEPQQEETEQVTKLYKFSEWQARLQVSEGMSLTLQWILDFLAKPHADLGRKGAVCPFIPISLEQDNIWLAELPGSNLDKKHVSDIILTYKEVFKTVRNQKGTSAMNKAIIVVFSGIQEYDIVDTVQNELKKVFVEDGLMLGEFHVNNESPGLRNSEFRPLRSPIPMLAIRHMVETDLPFLMHIKDSPSDRASFLKSYLSRKRAVLSDYNFDKALNGLVDSEIECRSQRGASETSGAL